jgi:hypothetical protein
MEFRALNDEQWQFIQPPLASCGPHRPPQGRRPEDPQWHPLRAGHWLPLGSWPPSSPSSISLASSSLGEF